ncbi:MAG: ABC transporter permease [candidate division Zixibacteria bacterium]|nr:ABC transporter permease [candidate division Zixibacteria bacterium]
MMIKIAFRNIFRQKKRSLLTILTMIGGFVLSAFSFGWSDGTYSNIIDLFTRTQLGHIQIHQEGYLDRPALYKTINDYSSVGIHLDTIPGLVAWSPRIYSSGLVSVDEKSTGARIIGIDPAREQIATRFEKKIIAGVPFSKEASYQAILGEGLAITLKAKIGDSIIIVSQGADGSIANDIYEIIALTNSGDKMYDKTAMYLHLDDAAELLVMYNQIHEIVIIGEDLDSVEELTNNIQGTLNNPELAVAPWQEFAKAFYEAMKADQQGTWILLFIIILIASIGVLNTVLMTVLERRREYGVLRALGTQPKQIIKLVISEVAVMAIISLLIGTLIALITNSTFSWELPESLGSITYGGVEFKTMTSELNARSFIIPAITVFFSALFVSILPAVKAARIAPAKAMRMH